MSPRILVVDDNEPLRYALGRTLRQNAFEVIEASTGEEALHKAASESPDLVLLDVNLPDIHGFEVARRLKHGEHTKTIPILHLSASSVLTEHKTEGLAAGADAYLVEPVEPGELVANIRALLRMRDAETGLQRTTALLAAVVDASPLPIVVFDRDAVVRTWNRAAERLIGSDSSQVVGRTASEVLKFLDGTLIETLTHGGTLSGVEVNATRRDGEPIALSVFAAPLTPASAGYVAIMEDISSRKAFERDRAEFLQREHDARREAEAANRLKDEFLATLSHELRTPLNAIMGWVRILRERPLDEAARDRALEIVERNAKSQQQLISDILEVSQIIRGQLRLDMQPVDLVASVRAAAESVAPTVGAKRLTLSVQLPDVPVQVAGDRERLQQVFWNLLTNALKYTPMDGRIAVTLVISASEAVVTVTDSGIGIPPHVLPHIFERFTQGDAGATREYGGLGLGLAIVRHLTEAHGGYVRADSDGPGKGASFVVTLPIAR